MILTQAQAKAVQDAMCALNNINGRIPCLVFQQDTWPTAEVRERPWGPIEVYSYGLGRETYANQDDFFKAYNLT